MVERRCATIRVVRPFIASRRPRRICASVVASTDAVASSRIRIRGSSRIARAIASRWRAARERDPALADHRVVAVRERRDEVVRLRHPRRTLDLLVARERVAEGDVLAHARGEEKRILRDDRDRAAQVGDLHVADVGAVQQDASLLDVVEAGHERRQRRLARAGVSDQRDRAAGRKWRASWRTGRSGS